jgi:hypothetical protein
VVPGHAIARPWRRGAVPIPAKQALSGLLVGLLTALLTILVVHEGNLKAVAVLIVIVGSLWFACTRRTALALALLMLYLGLLDGYLKLSTGSNYVTFVRDALLFAIALGVLVRAVAERKPLSAPPLSMWVIAFVVIVFAQLLNPHDGTLYHSLAGVRQHLEFVPLFFLTYAFVRTTKALRVFVVLLLLIAAANGVVSFVQFKISPQQFASWGPGYADRVLGVGGGFQLAGRSFYTSSGQLENRPFGLGSDAGDGGLVGAFAVGGLLALGAMARRRRDIAFVVVMGVAAVTAIVTSQGRAALVAAVVVALSYGLLTARSGGRAKTAISFCLAGLVALLVIDQVATSSSTNTFRYSGLGSSQIVQTATNARGRSIDAIPGHLKDYPFGDGLGVAGPANGVSGAPPQAGTIDAENEFSFAVIETGIPGMIALVGFTISLFVLGFRRIRLEADPEARLLLAALIAPIGGMLALYWVNSLSPKTPGGPYLWAVGGIAAYWLVTRQREQRRASVAAPLESI